jgi:ketosteroid isomerase-like protein
VSGEENVEIVRRLYAASKTEGLDEAIDTYVHPEVEWETRWPGLPPSFHGREGVKEWVVRSREPMEQMDVDLLDARGIGEDRVLTHCRLHGAGKSSGIPTEMPIFELVTFRDGLLWRRQIFYDEADALAAAESEDAPG